MFGCRILTAGNGTEAITSHSQHHQSIDLVVMDMMMPVLDGPATIHALAGINPEYKR